MKTITGKIIALTLVMCGIIFSQNAFAASCSLAAPASPNTTNIATTSATLNWSAVASAASYEVRYRVVSTTPWTLVSAITATTVNISSLTGSTNYEWQVHARCSNNVYSSNYSSLTAFATLIVCNTPTGLNTSGISQTTATLNWSPVTGAAIYNLRYRIVSAPSWTTTTSTSTSKAISSLTAGSNYEWQVQTNCGGTNNSAFSGSATFSTLIVCNTPTGLNTTGITQTAATLNWTTVSGAQSYNVQYRIVGNPTWTSTTSSTNSKAISSLTVGSNYEWQVKTNCGGTNTSSFSASSTFSTLIVCNTPTGLNTTGITSTDATLNWTTVSGAQSYNIQYRIVGDPSWTSTTSATNSKVVSSLNALSSYEWQVQTNCGGSNLSAYSSSATFSTLITPCNTPTGLSTSGITVSEATLNWTATAPAGAVTYNIQYRIVGDPSWTSVTEQSASLTITSLFLSTNYEWKVQTDCGNSNLSAFSNLETFTTLSPVICHAPAGLNTTGISFTGAILNWTNATGAVDYTVRYRIVGDPNWNIISPVQPSSSTISGLTGQSNYEWQVQTNCGNSNLSPFSYSSFFISDPNAVPLSAFHGTWVGTDVSGNAISVTLTPTWNCTFTQNGVPVHASNAITAYRLPQFSPREIAARGLPSTPEITIMFNTINAIHGILAPASANSSAPADNSLAAATVRQIYTGVALLNMNANPQTIDLYIDMNNFSSVPPAVSAATIADGSSVPYCTLIKQ